MPTGVYKRTKAPWNKGTKGLMPSLTPWNKGLTGVQVGWNKGMRGYVNDGSFKKGVSMEPWNKGLRGVQTGENSPNWKGGRTELSQCIRGQVDILELSKQRKQIDNFTCQICGQVGGYLNTDHYPMSFAEILDVYNINSLEEAICCEKLFDITNLRTLCESCHRLTKTFGRSRKKDARSALETTSK